MGFGILGFHGVLGLGYFSVEFGVLGFHGVLGLG